jgi:hypothetical protein
MGAARTPGERLDARRRRLDALLESGRTDRVNRTWGTLHEARRPREIVIRTPLIRSAASARPGAPDSPPASRMLSPRGQALRLYLLAVFEAHCTRPPGGVVHGGRRLLRQPESEEPGWTDLFAAPVYGPPEGDRTKERSGPAALVARQLQSGLVALEKIGLVELGRGRSWERFNGFRIMTESGPGDLADPSYYRVPKSTSVGLTVPAAFFLNGWLWALTNSEIAAYLMFRWLAAAFPGEHAGDGVYIYGDDREQYFGLRRDAYESHILLAQFGLIERQPSLIRDDDGHVVGYKKGVRYEAHKFKLTDGGLDDDGVLHVLAQLEG